MTTGTLPTRIHRLSRKRGFRALALGVVLIMLEALLFEGWLRGARVPPWDFLGAYAQEAYWWWEHGNFFDPVAWIPAVWGGYPASLSLQNSAWYLPYGVVSTITPLTPWVLAAVAALHVAFGSIGAYLFVRRYGAGFLPGIFAATGWFFAVGYFSNAEHPDIARGYSWLPWVLLIASTKWPWSRNWSIPVAALLLWQTVAGVYPGMLVAYAFVGIIWVIVQQVRSRRRFSDFLLPLAVATLAGTLLSMTRLIPYAIGNDLSGVKFADVSEWEWSLLLTVQFGYDYDFYPNDISMRSFFIPAGVIAAALFATWRSALTQLGTAILVPSVLLGLPAFPWFEALQSLPGLSLSRFTMSDFKVFMLFGVLLIATSAVDGLVRGRAVPKRPVRIVAALLVVLAFAIAGRILPVAHRDYGLTVAILLASTLLVIVISGRRRALTWLLIPAVVASGTLWAYSTRSPWRTDRVEAESSLFGAPVSELIVAERAAPPPVRRPERTPLPVGATAAEAQSTKWNVGYYTGQPAIGGYLNLKGNSFFEQLRKEILDGNRAGQLRQFLSEPGAALSLSALEDGCASERCGNVDVTPLAYSPGRLVYRVEPLHAGVIVFNEPYYTGWQARVCNSEECHDREVVDSRGLISIDVPEGASKVMLSYSPQGIGIGWLMFSGGVGIALLSPLALWFLRRGQRGQDDRGENDA